MKFKDIGGIKVDYKEIFKKFYDDSIVLSDELHNYTIGLEKGIALCILKKYLTSDDIPLGEELSAKKIFNILNIDANKDNIDLNLFQNYIVLKLKDYIRILLVPKNRLSKMVTICAYDGKFIMSTGYDSFVPLIKLSKNLDIPLYGVESNILKLRFKNLIDKYVNENRNSLLLLGCVDKNNIVDSSFKLNSEMKKAISESGVKNISIYEYLKEHYISNNLFNYTKKYPSVKKSETLINKLLIKYKKAELVSDSELLTDKVKNDFKINIEKSIAQRRALEDFIDNEWKEKYAYDIFVAANNEVLNMIDDFNKIIKKNPTNIIIKNRDITLFDSTSVRNFQLLTSIMSSYVKLGDYIFKKISPVIECYNPSTGTMSKVIKLENISDREGFSIYEDGIRIYPFEK